MKSQLPAPANLSLDVHLLPSLQPTELSDRLQVAGRCPEKFPSKAHICLRWARGKGGEVSKNCTQKYAAESGTWEKKKKKSGEWSGDELA
jgi:hypothetical protein